MTRNRFCLVSVVSCAGCATAYSSENLEQDMVCHLVSWMLNNLHLPGTSASQGQVGLPWYLETLQLEPQYEHGKISHHWARLSIRALGMEHGLSPFLYSVWNTDKADKQRHG